MIRLASRPTASARNFDNVPEHPYNLIVVFDSTLQILSRDVPYRPNARKMNDMLIQEHTLM